MPRPRVEPKVVLAIASLGAAIAFVDATIVNIAFPNIGKSFKGTSISNLSWVLNAYNIVFAAFLVAGGRLADLLGRRRIFVLGLAIFTVASLLCAVAPSVDALIGFRILQALGAACLVPSSLALVLNAFPPERRAHGVALLSAVGAAAAGLGPSLGGLLVSIADWRLVFLVNVPIGVAAILLSRRRLVESRTPGRRRMPDLLGALLLAVAIAAVVLGVVKGQEWGWASARIIAAFAVGAAAGATFTWRCTWHRSPIVDLSLLRIRTFSAANGMTIIAAAGFYGYTLTNVLFLTGVWRYSVLQAGLALTPGPFVAAAVAGPTSATAQRMGHRAVLVAGGLIWGGAVMWFVEVVGLRPDFLGEWLPGIVLLGIGAGTLFPNLSAAAVASAPGESFGTATGLNSVSRQVGAALGVAIVVALIGNPSPQEAQAVFQHAWTFGAVCLFAAGVGGLLVKRITVEEAPSLADAARLVLAPETAVARRTEPLRARRALTIGADGRPHRRALSTAEFLSRVPMLHGLEPATLDALAAHARLLTVAAGEWLFHQGDAGDAMYIVSMGRMEIVDADSGSVIRALGRGDVLGELALLTASTRSASARAARTSEVVVIERADFERLLESSATISLALSRSLAEQLRDTRAPVSAVRPLPVTVALVALEAGVPLGELGRGLAEALGSDHSVAMLDSEVAHAGSGTGTTAAEAASLFGPLVDRAEAAHDIVVLVADARDGMSEWDEYCVRHADRLLAVARGDASRTGAVAQDGASGARDVATTSSGGERPELRGCDLVGLDVTPAAGALRQWSERLDPIESHAVRTASMQADLERIARKLTGRSLAVVLSGGGARAFAHIGVLEELSAAGLVIDRLAGVSMGAFVGALFAMGLDPNEIDARCFDAWVRRRPLADYTLPRHALIRGARVLAMLEDTFGEVAIEDLERSFMSGSTDLRTGELVISRSGRLGDAVRLSVALPIIGPPQVHGSQIVVDGSLADNLPVETVANMGEGPIIAVDVKAAFERPHRDGAAIGAERRLHTPSLGETLTRVLLLGSSNTSEQARRHADLIITPRTDGVGLLEFHQIDAAREAGRIAARRALEADVSPSPPPT